MLSRKITGKKTLAVLVAFVLLGALGAQVYGQTRARRIIEQQIRQLEPLAEVSYADISFNLLSLRSTVNNIRVDMKDSPMSVYIDSVTINRYDTANKPPHFSDTEVRGMKIDFSDPSSLGPRMAQTGGILRAMGYKTLTLDLTSSHSYEAADKSLTQSVEVNAHDMGMLRLSLALGGIDLDDNQSALSALPLITIVHASAEYRDSSFAGKAITMMAKQKLQTPEEMTSTTQARLDRILETEDSPVTIKTIKAIKGFLDNPGSLTMTLSPESPVTVGELAPLPLEAILERLNFDIHL